MSSASYFSRSFGSSVNDAPTHTAQDWKRQWLSAIVGIVVGATTWYGAAQLASFAIAGALVLTGSAFLSYIVWVLMVIGGALAALEAGARVAGYISSGALDADVRGFVSRFRRDDVIEEAVKPAAAKRTATRKATRK